MARRAPVPNADADDRLTAERRAIAAAQRDPARFDALYEANFERVYAFVVRRVRDRDTARDVTAEVFHRALEHLPRFEWRGVPFAAWLFRMAANAIVDRAARAAREAGDAAEAPAATVEPAALEEAEERARLFRLVATLPPDQRAVIAARFAEQRSIREVAVALGRSEGAVKQLQFRALTTLRARMGGRT
jgi:RNA polymerase sigma-70 factor (ECF subfamily)